MKRRKSSVLFTGALLLFIIIEVQSTDNRFSSQEEVITMVDSCLHIDFERTGGFAGTTISGNIDAKKLSSQEAEHLNQLIDEAQFFQLPESIATRSVNPDRFQYQISVSECSRKHTINVSDEAMPEKLKPLVNWILEKVRKRNK